MHTLRARETAFIIEVQKTRVARACVGVAKGLSLFGEHAAGWILLGLLGAVLEYSALATWLWSVLAVVIAHGLSVAVKRVIRRLRPAAADGVIVYATAPSRLGFPSSHASSTMAAAIVYTAFFPALWPIAVLVTLAMGASRVVLGLHFPTDVLAGFVLGLAVGVPTVLLLH